MEFIIFFSVILELVLLVLIFNKYKVLYDYIYNKIRKLELRLEVLENECSRFNK